MYLSFSPWWACKLGTIFAMRKRVNLGVPSCRAPAWRFLWGQWKQVKGCAHLWLYRCCQIALQQGLGVVLLPWCHWVLSRLQAVCWSGGCERVPCGGFDLHVLCTNEVEPLLCSWTLCFFPFCDSPVQILFPFFFLMSSPKMQNGP